jgi:hypothetical protein
LVSLKIVVVQIVFPVLVLFIIPIVVIEIVLALDATYPGYFLRIGTVVALPSKALETGIPQGS